MMDLTIVRMELLVFDWQSGRTWLPSCAMEVWNCKPRNMSLYLYGGGVCVDPKSNVKDESQKPFIQPKTNTEQPIRVSQDKSGVFLVGCPGQLKRTLTNFEVLKLPTGRTLQWS